jgi:hypothetical protein
VKEEHPYSFVSDSTEAHREGVTAVEELRGRIPHLLRRRHIYYKELQAIGFNLIYRHIVN